LRRKRTFGEKARQGRPIAAEHHLRCGKSDGYACDDAESRNENGDSQNEKQKTEGAFLQMAEKPVEIDGVFGASSNRRPGTPLLARCRAAEASPLS
jgi:hypothetical protein